MATETLTPNGDKIEEWTASAGSDHYALVNDDDDDTYNTWPSAVPPVAPKFIVYETDTLRNGPALTLPSSVTAVTQAVNSTDFSSLGTITKTSLTNLSIGGRQGTGGSLGLEAYTLSNPTFSDDATINSATIHARISKTGSSFRIHEISLVVDYTEVVADRQTLLILKSGNLKITGGKVIIK